MNLVPEEQDPAMEAGVAAEIRMGVARALIEADQAVLAEMPLANGRRADLAAMDKAGKITIVEVKSSLADYRADHKWRHYLEYCDFFYFAVNVDFPKEVLPDDEGLMIADRYGAEILRPSQHRPMSAARRKAVLIRFGRLAAGRLHGQGV